MNRRTMILGGLAATAARSQSKDSGSTVKERVAEAERAFAATMARRDHAAFASHVSEEAIFFGGADGQQPVRGRKAVSDAWKRFFEGPTAPFSWGPDVSEVLDSGTLGLTSGPVRDAKGTVTGRFTSIWRLEADGRWRVIFDKGCRCG
jgi:ketosteroid isomerase-like protein